MSTANEGRYRPLLSKEFHYNFESTILHEVRVKLVANETCFV